MPNLILYDNQDRISHFVKNCRKIAKRSYVGDNCKIKVSCKLHEKWISGEPTPIYKDEYILGYKEKASDFIEVDKFMGEVVSSETDVDSIINDNIRYMYTEEEELKLHRLKLAGQIDDAVWDKYMNDIYTIVNKGKQFKESM